MVPPDYAIIINHSWQIWQQCSEQAGMVPAPTRPESFGFHFFSRSGFVLTPMRIQFKIKNAEGKRTERPARGVFLILHF
jgi:hypothetical protein